jgi:hypothetical protein
VFERSIAGLRRLNALGYGQPGERPGAEPGLQPAGPRAAAAAGPLEADYKRELAAHFGIVFNPCSR